MTADDLPVPTKLALDRTRLAYERTLMAWVRTAVSLISFGFTIYKFFEFERGGRAQSDEGIGPRTFALLMIGIGVTALVLAALEHRRSLHALVLEGSAPSSSLALSIALMVGLLGVVGFASVLLRL
jgi:putative membrane protein